MTVEEVAELFEDDEMGERTRAVLKRAGKRISKATIAKMEEAITHHQRGIDCLREMMDEDTRDDEGEMAHKPEGTREVETDPGFDRAAFAARIRLLQNKGALLARVAA